MRAAQAEKGREFVVAFDDGEDFFPALEEFCTEHSIRSGYIPVFLGGFRSARLVGTCGPMDNPDAPLWDSVQVDFLEACGSGTLARDPDTDTLPPTSTSAPGSRETRPTGGPATCSRAPSNSSTNSSSWRSPPPA